MLNLRNREIFLEPVALLVLRKKFCLHSAMAQENSRWKDIKNLTQSLFAIYAEIQVRQLFVQMVTTNP